jgi:hypothetical protein
MDLIIPDAYKVYFIFAETFCFCIHCLPESSVTGYAYLVIENEGDHRRHFIFGLDTEYETFTPTYGWTLGYETITNQYKFCSMTLPLQNQFTDTINGGTDL